MEISEFQELIRNLYFRKDKERGALGTFAWFIEEVGEVAEHLKQGNPDTRLLGSELADVVAWTFSLANIFDVDMELALQDKYPGACGKCGQNPCECEE